jgi:phospholipid-translocating ATPase
MPPDGRRRKRKAGISKLYSFATCGKKGFGEEHSRIGSPGFSRIVYVNDPNCVEAQLLNYTLNYISTTKYTLLTFLPKSLFEQFRRVANFYFLLSGCLAFTPLAPYTAVSAILPLLVVIGATMAKEGIEDWRRKQQVLFFQNIYSEFRIFFLFFT